MVCRLRVRFFSYIGVTKIRFATRGILIGAPHRFSLRGLDMMLVERYFPDL